MDYEQKYKEALEIARKINNGEGVAAPHYRTICEAIFSELRESEDEKIRKALIYLVKSKELGGYMIINNVSTGSILAWLEKQGEQKPVLDFNADDRYVSKVDGEIHNIYHSDKEPKFKVGDWIIFDESHNSVYQVEQIDSCRYYLRHYLGSTMSVYFDNELIRQWTIQDAKDGDVLCYKDEVFLYNKHDIKDCTEKETSFGGIVYYCCYDGNNFITDSFYSLTEKDKIDIHPATKEQRELLFQKMKEASYKWNNKKKELRKIEKQWKPSEKQMKALHDLNLIGNISYVGQAQLLIELYNDLKKLIE